MIDNAQSHNHYDHSEGAHMRKCIVIRQALCSASSAISGDAAEGGARIFGICTVLHFQTYRRGDLGTEPTPEHMWSCDKQ